MELGYFSMPSHPPERGLKAGHDWDLQTLRWLDELGYTEAWIGEHHTAPWEPHPAPDLLVAQALLQTKRLRIGPGGFLLPYHHPAELANRVAMLDHLSEGRLMFGVAASGLPSDWAMFNVDGMSGQNREMTREALDIILRLWSDEPTFEHHGKYWNVDKPEHDVRLPEAAHQAVAEAASADRRGRAVEELRHAEDGGRARLPAAEPEPQSGLCRHPLGRGRGRRASAPAAQPHRRDWRMVREVFVAETDAEAMRLSVGGMMGRMMREYFLPLLGNFGFLEYLKHDPSVPDSDVTPEYCAQHNWLIGSPATVAEKLERVYHEVGGFGNLLVFGFDYSENPQAWHNSLRLLAQEVAPRIKHLTPA